ncbi:unnamed protein product [Ambrosiozyma monospora]|uniref:Unnamed protein product n=1 Tax=Ambrosiozyma monospora TaxID=43982 RepID=A0ACB5U5A2_AMBMO|nr:unnamed protein product [Ambrosiozyma monospora]
MSWFNGLLEFSGQMTRKGVFRMAYNSRGHHPMPRDERDILKQYLCKSVNLLDVLDASTDEWVLFKQDKSNRMVNPTINQVLVLVISKPKRHIQTMFQDHVTLW